VKKALITGVAGQDGCYLSEFLLKKGYDVYGIKRPTETTEHISHRNQVTFLDADMTDGPSLYRVIETVMPDEIYNLAGISHVGVSWDMQSLVRETNFFGVIRLMDAVKRVKPSAKVYQASSCEMFGGVESAPQNEDTPFKPVSPYAESKVEAHKYMQVLRRKGLFAACGILFNHESPMRPLEFVTRKITDGVARIVSGQNFVIKLGNLNSVKDWGFAGDYVKAMWLMLQHSSPDDFAIGTGEKHTVRDFVTEAFAAAGKKIEWKGQDLEEKGYVDNKLAVQVDPAFFRPHDTMPLVADISKAKRLLNWQPEVSFKQLVEMMVKADMAHYQKHRAL